jgi:hypothetical protein
VNLIAEGQFGRMVAYHDDKITSVCLAEAVARQRLVERDGELVDAAKAIGISLGD